MSGTRRRFFQDAAVFGAGLFGLRETLHAGTPESTLQSPRENENGRHHSPYGSHGPHPAQARAVDRKSTRLNSSHGYISYAVFCLKKKKNSTRRNSRSRFTG